MDKSDVFDIPDELMNKVNTLANEDTLEAHASSQAFARDAGSNSLRSDKKPRKKREVSEEEKERLLNNLRKGRETIKQRREAKKKEAQSVSNVKPVAHAQPVTQHVAQPVVNDYKLNNLDHYTYLLH